MNSNKGDSEISGSPEGVRAGYGAMPGRHCHVHWPGHGGTPDQWSRAAFLSALPPQLPGGLGPLTRAQALARPPLSHGDPSRGWAHQAVRAGLPRKGAPKANGEGDRMSEKKS